MLHTAICKHTVANVNLSFSGTCFLMTNFWSVDIYVSSTDLCLHMVTDVTLASMVDGKQWQIFYTSNINTRLRQGLTGKESACNAGDQETRIRSLGWEDAVEEEMTIHSSTLAWKIPWTEEPKATVYRVAKSWTQLNTHLCTT